MSDIVLSDFSYLQQYGKFVSSEDFWEEVIIQLNKDLNKQYAINVPFSNLRGEHAAELIVGVLQKYLPSVTPELSEMLYRIDIAEQQVELLKGLAPDIYYRCLSEMVLKRIILKVITRKMSSGKKSIS